MPIHFTGLDGFYEIYNLSSIIQKKYNSSGELIFQKNHDDLQAVANQIDRERIIELLAVESKPELKY
ncbi:MAG: hypothetical protein IPM56_19355 [Ignavibacteriales bacterium]|nr:MAG: hypothetical protein IPM56_19355 [Ignavibacteriales bacterium]